MSQSNPLIAGALGLAVLVAGSPARAAARVTETDLTYLGAFAFPAGVAWAWSGGAIAYRPDGDPGGAADGYPGSLFVAGHDQFDLVGEISIPPPVASHDFASLPRATVLQDLRDVTNGLLAITCHACTSCDCATWNVDGLAYLPAVDRLAWNLHDWYNAGAEDLDSLGWSTLDMSGAAGVWHIGPRPNPNPPQPFHNAKTCDYLLTAPPQVAAQQLGGRSLIAGNHRESGAFGGSQGPTLYATAPWLDGTPPAPGQDLDALALVYYPWVEACSNNQFDQCIYPGYRVDDTWGGAVWIGEAGLRGILFFGLKGLGDNCYGDPGVECPAPACDPYRGWHSDPYEPQILFYDPDEVLGGASQPWDSLPYHVYRPLTEVFDPDCGVLSSASYDRADRLIYVAERTAGPDGETVVHVWEVRAPIFEDGFESGDTSAWSMATGSALSGS